MADRDALAALLSGLEADGDPVRAVFHAAGDVSLVKWLAADTTTAELARVVAGRGRGRPAPARSPASPARRLRALLLRHRGVAREREPVCLLRRQRLSGRARRAPSRPGADGYLDAVGPVGRAGHEEYDHELTRRGLRLMETGPALMALDRALGRDETATVVVDMD
ncbi:hypothetical protein ACRAWF_06890 [Streptomyces sp. L7]